MHRFAFLAVAVVSSPALASPDRGPCPGAYIDVAYWEARYHERGYVPIKVEVEARTALQRCHRAGIKVPETVDEYNHQLPGIDGRSTYEQLEWSLNTRRQGEF